MAIQFKLRDERSGQTRRISFPNQPIWRTLASKINTLYDIPFDKIAVTYIDADDDKVTLSTQDELQDFFQATHKSGEVVKFTVQDMRLSRADLDDKSLPETPRAGPTSHRDTFGGDPNLPFHVDDDWQSIRVPNFTNMFMPPDTEEHGFVESVPESLDSSSDDDSIAPHPLDKGKGKAFDFSSSVSTDSIPPPFRPFNTDRSSLPPLSAHSTPHFSNIVPSPPKSNKPSSVAPVIGNQSTPKEGVSQGMSGPVESEAPKVNNESVADATQTLAAEYDDPPLAPLEDAHPTPSLTRDVASVIDAFSSAFAAHPELSEGFRNLIKNAANGSYWTAHREALHQAATEYSQVARTELEKAEEEAATRVSYAIAHLARIVAQAAGVSVDPSAAGSGERSPAGGASAPSPRASWHPWFPPFYNSPGGRGRGGHHGGGPRRGISPPFGPHGWAPPPGAHRPGPPPPPGSFPPRMHRDGPPGLSPHMFPARPPLSGHGFPPPPPPPDHGFPSPPDHDNRHAFPPHWSRREPPPPPFADFPSPKSTPQELRAQVEAAKLLYKAEKERYRRDRAERQRAKMWSHRLAPPPPSPPPAEMSMEDSIVPKTEETEPIIPPASPPVSIPIPPTPQLVSQARGRYPQLEMTGVPRRANTYHGHTVSLSPADRAVGRIVKKLGDMGFTEKGHPDMTLTIRSHVPPDVEVTKEVEDNIVTTFIEELDAGHQTPPKASGSKAVPGAWE
ncbi:uncharacterized protein BT62DRAFT_926507 [Guyanagaster necrorhizus]|uniref:PB1 domain-containing protein n=1 Tax=Guyanagaster necrorhizus TaxID=856835 RepID=A0A9P7W5G6_9AGAR|nr:uncharacterized protein BT62DRAFT_926507 [Guyanagaster necrorhizus MCA 3950]KAG7452295.1 hypothetical protein BT62DRAFT_926507 [Guyanagaster necrorhizus MCA 3950]